MKNRTFTISNSSRLDVTKKEATCFTHQLVKDASNPKGKRLYKWELDANAGVDAGAYAFCSDGLAEGSHIKLCTINENGKTGIQFSFFKNGELWYAANEFDGDNSNDMHLACLYRIVKQIAQAPQPKAAHQPAPNLTKLVQSLNPEVPESAEPTEPMEKVGDIFRRITAEQLAAYMFANGPSMVTMGITQGSPAWIQRENMVRSLVTYIQNVPPKNNGFRLVGFGLKRLKDNQMCGLVTTVSLGRIANAEVKFQETKYYTCLKPTEATLKFAADIVSQLVLFS